MVKQLSPMEAYQAWCAAQVAANKAKPARKPARAKLPDYGVKVPAKYLRLPKF